MWMWGRVTYLGDIGDKWTNRDGIGAGVTPPPARYRRDSSPGLDPIHCTASNQRSLEPQPAWVGRSEEAPYRGVTSPFVSGGSSSTALEYGGFQQCSPRPASPARLPGTDWEIGSRAPRGLGLGVRGSWRTGSGGPGLLEDWVQGSERSGSGPQTLGVRGVLEVWVLGAGGAP